jgi:2,3-bisphosphoglycerate-dependent phosphoglycerate mutase
MQVTRIFAIRHGETAWNVDTRIQGPLDIDLNDTGRWQAAQVAVALSEEAINAIYSSDLQRAMNTAQAIAAQTRQGQVHPWQGLRERHFGHFQGKTWHEIETQWPSDAQQWRSRDPLWQPLGGESLTQLRERIAQSVHQIAIQHIGQAIVLVAHGGVMDTLYRLATKQAIQAPRTWHLGNAAINRLLWTPDQGLSLVGWGDVSHLEISRDESSS